MKKLKRLCAIVIAVLMLASIAACSSDSKIDELNRKMDRLEDELLLSGQIEELNRKIKELEDELSLKNAYGDDNKIPYGNLLDDEYMGGELDGAAAVERGADVIGSTYYTLKDYYNMKSTNTLTILEQFKTIQQATEWTCGPTSALMVLEWFGRMNNLNEMDLARLRRATEEERFEGATNLREMIRIFEQLNEDLLDGEKWVIESTYNTASLDLETEKISSWDDRKDPDLDEDMIMSYLKRGIPVIVGTDEWGGHWQVIIGYDDMGTDDTADDVLILADPYDTTDHCQDGYVVQSFERLYYNWKNTFDPVFKKNVFLAVYPEGL